MDDYIQITFHIHPRGETRSAHILPDVSIGRLREEIERKFQIERVGAQKIYIWQEGQRRPLSIYKTLAEEEVTEGSILEVGFEPPKPPSQEVPEGFFESSGSSYLDGIQVSLVDEKRGLRYKVPYAPMVIGRSNLNTIYPHLQRINLALQDFGDDARQVSRDHAIIMKQEDKNVFFLVAVAGERQNYTYLNDFQMDFFYAYRLSPHDQIRLGESNIVFSFEIG